MRMPYLKVRDLRASSNRYSYFLVKNPVMTLILNIFQTTQKKQVESCQLAFFKQFMKLNIHFVPIIRPKQPTLYVFLIV